MILNFIYIGCGNTVWNKKNYKMTEAAAAPAEAAAPAPEAEPAPAEAAPPAEETPAA